MKAVNFAQDICFIGKNCVCLESLYKYVLVLNRNRNSWRETEIKAYLLDQVFSSAFKGAKNAKIDTYHDSIFETSPHIFRNRFISFRKGALTWR